MKTNKHKNFNIYNANYEQVLFDVLSDNNPKHSGRIIINDDDIENVSLVRLQHNNIDTFDFCTRKFIINGKNRILSSCFSIYQFQSNIIDIPFQSDFKDFDFKMPLNYAEFCNVLIYQGSLEEQKEPKFSTTLEGRNDDYEMVVSLLSLQKPLQTNEKKEAYVVLQNTSRENKSVNLVDLFYQYDSTNFIESPLLKIKNIHFDSESRKFKMIRVWSKNQNAITDIIEYNDEKITTLNYFSANQFQSSIIDIPKDFEINPETKIIVNIPSNTTILYHFM